MGIRYAAARTVSALSTWGLKTVFHRPAGNFPGKIALYIDPQVIAHTATKLREGSIVVVGTNGKTTTTNLVADALERAGKRVVCNRGGANLDSGVATSLLHAKESDWGVFESDELWLAKILPQLRATYVVLLNLFRDQLDRVGEIDRIQDSIVGALGSSPDTVLVYNADDPLCARIAERARELPGRENTREVAIGVAESMGLPQNTVADATMCQRCSTMFEYDFRQYGQLGQYRCPNCGFARPELDYAAEGVRLGSDGLSFSAADRAGSRAIPVRASFTGAYMVYNLLAVATAADLAGCSAEALQSAIDAFDPKNGRLEELSIGGRAVLLNLAKNPVGFNQNLELIMQHEGPVAAAFFVNDKEGDGHDVSWLWDIDFEKLAAHENLTAFAGGIRAADVQVRLKYAGVDAEIAETGADAMARIGKLPTDVKAFLIANYTALPGVQADAERLAGESVGAADAPAGSAPAVEPAASPAAASEVPAAEGEPVVIAHLFPDLLNLYGDGGNVRVIAHRLAARGIPYRVERVNHGETIDLAKVDFVLLGGGPDREQRLASSELARMADDLRAFVEADGALLAICGGYQILGSKWLLGDEIVDGLGVLDIETRRPGTSADRLIDNIVVRSSIAERPVVGYENHAGRTFLGQGVEPFGRVVSSCGHGNNDSDGADGVLYKSTIGTYLHGPILAKNPEVADWLIARALDRRAARTGEPAPALEPLDDTVEENANAILCKRFGVKE